MIIEKIKKIIKEKATNLTIVKYVFSLVITFLAFFNIGDARYFFANIFELLLIFTISNILIKKKTLGLIVNNILMLLYNAQMMVMVFAHSYITMLMITNLTSVKALAGKAALYITGALLVLIFSLLPIQKLEFTKVNLQHLLTSILSLELIFTLFFGNAYSPIYSYLNLGIQQYELTQMNKYIEDAVHNTAESDKSKTDTPTDINSGFNTTDDTSDSVQDTHSYYKDEVADHREKSHKLTEQPNVILLLTEGLSQSIVSDERAVMEHISNYQKSALTFTNYYNHTFATYRGIIGQLYSGYQLKNLDTNELVSLQSVLSDEGYHTSFINTEPYNAEFTAYLESFGFDDIIGDTSYNCNGESNSISDKDAYEILFHTAKEQSEKEKPFFITMYTFGTHVSFDSPDEKFGNGSSPELNKFYNLDQQFEAFMQKFMTDSMSDNTIIVFTTDHATYKDESYDSTFPLYMRTAASLDEVPFFIFHKGITPECIDVNGRNSLCLAPTILDYLDISAPNYFLGTSLFADKESSTLETTYSDSYTYYSTKNDIISDMTKEEQSDFRSMQQEYFITKEMAAND